MRIKKIVILLLCFALTIGTFVACADQQDDENPFDNQGYYDGTSRETARDTIPDGYSLKGETIGILYAGHIEKEVIGDNEALDIVYTKIYERNQKVEARLECELDFITSGTSFWQDFCPVLDQAVKKLDDSFQITMSTNNTIIQEKLFTLFHNLNDSAYIELDEEWWYKEATLECSVDGYYYRLLFGDILLSGMGNHGAIYYNKDLYSEYVDPGNPDGLYDLVFEGKWTLDRLDIAVRNSYVPRGGENDIYGYTLIRYGEPLHYFPISCGIEFYKRDAAGYPTITVNSDKSIEFTQKLYNLLYNNPGAHLYYPNMIDQEKDQPMFTDGAYIFSFGSIGSMLNETMREMDYDFGVLPYPKWDDDQEMYITMNANGSTLVGCTKNCPYDYAMEQASAVIEALCSESYRSVTLAFYETALQRAYSRDDTTAQMIDIICGNHETVKSVVTKNFLYEYGSSIGGVVGSIFQKIMAQGKTGNPNFTSTYEGAGNAQTLLKELYDDYVREALEG